ncbi:CFEM domain-containing protein [Aspergillus undulatus]|uniref:CFEM domain-containing protein n=1 Tax=Aspergillus undulatus TaxID=1810928 RepID=UPI003CCD2A08
MKLQSLALSLAACLSSAAAQGMAGLPDCAEDCAFGSIPAECNGINVECICASRSFIEDMACCVSTACEKPDQDAALEFANGICGGAGVTDLPQTATCAGDSTNTTTASGDETTTATSETTSTATTISENDVTSTGAETTTTETPTHTHATQETETPTSTETPAEPEETDGAVHLRGQEVGILAGMVAGVAFMM